MPTPVEPLVTIRNLTVRYGSFVALNNFSCDIPEGCTGLLGPNGAGKTTLLKTLLGFVKPSAGTAVALGLDIARENKEIRQKIGLMPEQDCHIPGLSAVGYVAYAGSLAGMPAAQALRRAHEVLEYCGLGEARYRNVETYSTGMKQRIKLAQAMIHGPRLLLLDEPTNGLDPSGREDMLTLIRDVSRAKGVNVLVCSHLLPDIERVCDQVVVVTKGTLRSAGSVKDLKKISGDAYDIELKADSAPFMEALVGRGHSVQTLSYSTYRLSLNHPEENLYALVCGVASQVGAQVRGFRPAQRSLEDAFLEAIDTDPTVAQNILAGGRA